MRTKVRLHLENEFLDDRIQSAGGRSNHLLFGNSRNHTWHCLPQSLCHITGSSSLGGRCGTWNRLKIWLFHSSRIVNWTWLKATLAADWNMVCLKAEQRLVSASWSNCTIEPGVVFGTSQLDVLGTGCCLGDWLLHNEMWQYLDINGWIVSLFCHWKWNSFSSCESRCSQCSSVHTWHVRRSQFHLCLMIICPVSSPFNELLEVCNLNRL